MGHDVIVVTGASSGFARLSAEALALAGHTVYASMRDTKGRNASQVEAVGYFAKDNGVDLRTVEMDVQSESSVDGAIEEVFNANGRSESTGPCCRARDASSKAFWCGYPAAAQPGGGGHRLIWRRISRPKPRWTRSRWPTRAS